MANDNKWDPWDAVIIEHYHDDADRYAFYFYGYELTDDELNELPDDD